MRSGTKDPGGGASSASTATPESAADLRLGQAVRERRHALGKTLVEVAAASELSHSFLSQLERGLARPSMRSLYLIAEALQTTQQTLLARSAGATSPEAGLVDVGLSQTLAVQAGSARLLSHVDDGADVTEFVNVPEQFEGYFSHGRHEFVYVVSGHLEIELRAEGSDVHAGPDDTGDAGAPATELHSLTARQSIGYSGATLHRHRRVGPEDCIIVVVHSGPEHEAHGAADPAHRH